MDLHPEHAVRGGSALDQKPAIVGPGQRFARVTRLKGLRMWSAEVLGRSSGTPGRSKSATEQLAPGTLAAADQVFETAFGRRKVVLGRHVLRCLAASSPVVRLHRPPPIQVSACDG